MNATKSNSTKNKTPQKTKDKIIAWEAPEYEYVEKTKDWFWVVGSIGALVSIGSFWMGNWSFATLVVLATIVMIYLAIRKPNIIQVQFHTGKQTITVDKTVHHLKDFQAFTISEYSGNLLLQSNNKFAPLKVIPLPQDAPSTKIIDTLEDDLEFTRDESLHEPMLEIILHRLGF
jgi:hypothetical protein